MDKEVQRLFMLLPENKLRVALLLRDIILGSSATITETIKWGRVTFCHHAVPVAFLCMHRKRPGVELGFFRAIAFDNAGASANKRKSTRIRFLSTEDIPGENIRQWILLASQS